MTIVSLLNIKDLDHWELFRELRYMRTNPFMPNHTLLNQIVPCSKYLQTIIYRTFQPTKQAIFIAVYVQNKADSRQEALAFWGFQLRDSKPPKTLV